MITPKGTKDILFEECRARRKIEKNIKDIFTSRAYNEVISPGLEFFDVFDLDNASVPQHEMYKTTDNKGRIVVFRPDSTLPVARLVATRLKKHTTPLRLFYNQSVYRNNPDLSGKTDENFQAGIELMGAQGLMADLEVICIAIETLKDLGLKFRLEIGNASFFTALIKKLNLDDDTVELIRSTIESKNYAALNDIMQNIEPSPQCEAVKRLPRLFGGEEVFDIASEFCTDDDTKEPLEYLKKLYNALGKANLAENIMLDLGLVQRNDYYTGIVFSAYVENHGTAVLFGGRYDNLLEKFDAPMPAVGFGIDVDAVTDILLEYEDAPITDYLVFAENDYEIEAQMKVLDLINHGYICETSFANDIEEATLYAKQKGIKKVLVVGKKITEESV